MSLHVERAGLLTTVQAEPRTGQRHLGVPASGAADALSMALANRLVANHSFAAALEITFDGPTLGFDAPARVALTGADCPARLNDDDVPAHESIAVRAGDRLQIGRCGTGARAYLAVAGGIDVPRILESRSTYLPAALGGGNGRALQAGDRLAVGKGARSSDARRTPLASRPLLTHAWVLRTCAAAEADHLDKTQWRHLFADSWIVGRRADRMGLRLEGPRLAVATTGRMPSNPVFPGTVQCPGDGTPFLLGVDAQTTGGYPRLLQVARCDRHIIGQLRPGDRVRFVERTPAAAARELRQKHEMWRHWLPDIAAIV